MIFIVFYFLTPIQGCLIAGQQLGVCLNKPLPRSSFCFAEIGDYVCVPAHNKTWSQYDAAYKDKVIEQKFLENVQKRLLQEYVDRQSLQILANNPSCYNAYKKFVCQWNFPKCSQSHISQSMCLTICEAFYSNCRGELNRCSILLKNIDVGIDLNC